MVMQTLTGLWTASPVFYIHWREAEKESGSNQYITSHVNSLLTKLLCRLPLACHIHSVTNVHMHRMRMH